MNFFAFAQSCSHSVTQYVSPSVLFSIFLSGYLLNDMSECLFVCLVVSLFTYMSISWRLWTACPCFNMIVKRTKNPANLSHNQDIPLCREVELV